MPVAAHHCRGIRVGDGVGHVADQLSDRRGAAALQNLHIDHPGYHSVAAGPVFDQRSKPHIGAGDNDGFGPGHIDVGFILGEPIK